jgi:hypothetical protein
MVWGRFLLLLPKRSRLQSFFSEKKASELESSKGWTAMREERQQLSLARYWYSGTAAHTWILLLETLGVHLPQGVEVTEGILGLRE